MRYPDAVRFDAGRLGDTLVRGADGKSAPLSALADGRPRRPGQTVLTRENLRQMALVSGRLEGRDLGSAVAEITATLRDIKLPVGYTWEVGGQYLAQRQAFRELLEVLGDRVRAGVRHPRRAVPRVPAGRPDPRRPRRCRWRARSLR